jgi:3-methyladenine DNA glycosylase AlkD
VSAAAIVRELRGLGDPEIARHSQRFFRTGPGEYGEGDRFLGIRVPALRKLVPQHFDEPLSELARVLQSDYHEARLFALLALVRRFQWCEDDRAAVVKLYLENTRWVNNWDLVDSSAPYILGAWLIERDRGLLFGFARSTDLWERRIAIIATQHFIRQRDLDDTFAIAEILVNDPHDLIHKAVGWMLREAGLRDLDAERAFLRRHARSMPRTMLRYAIERFPEPERKAWLAGVA